MKKIIVPILLLVVAGVVGIGLYFNSHYVPNTVIDYGLNSIEVGNKSYEEVAEMLKQDLGSHKYNITKVDGDSQVVLLKDISESIVIEDIVNLLKTNREGKITEKEFEIAISDLIVFNEEKINSVFNSINNDFVSNPITSKDAYISYIEDKKQYEIISEVIGNELIDNADEIIKNEIINYNFDLNLVDLGCYIMPNIYKDNEILLNNLELYKKYETLVLTYSFGDNKETLDISFWNKWMTPQYSEANPEVLKVENPFVLNQDSVDDYVLELARKYNTYGKARTFVTSTGEVKQITKGDYGWILNKKKMSEDIMTHFSELKSEEKEAIFSQKAISFGENDFTNSYVEVSIPEQRVWMYVNGECIVNTPVVTGNISKGHNTREGVFSLTYKTRNATLRGADYASFVYYWMPFDGGIGLHDATWRGSFGGKIYKTNGSHGCVNMPLEAAKTVYNNLESNMPIIVWD